jgi:hypothetical protein
MTEFIIMNKMKICSSDEEKFGSSFGYIQQNDNDISVNVEIENEKDENYFLNNEKCIKNNMPKFPNGKFECSCIVCRDTTNKNASTTCFCLTCPHNEEMNNKCNCSLCRKENNMISLMIKDHYKTISFDVYKNNKVETLIQNIFQVFCLHSNDFYLKGNGRILNPNLTFQEQNIKYNDTFEIFFRLRGGSFVFTAPVIPITTVSQISTAKQSISVITKSRISQKKTSRAANSETYKNAWKALLNWEVHFAFILMCIFYAKKIAFLPLGGLDVKRLESRLKLAEDSKRGSSKAATALKNAIAWAKDLEVVRFFKSLGKNSWGGFIYAFQELLSEHAKIEFMKVSPDSNDLYSHAYWSSLDWETAFEIWVSKFMACVYVISQIALTGTLGETSTQEEESKLAKLIEDAVKDKKIDPISQQERDSKFDSKTNITVAANYIPLSLVSQCIEMRRGTKSSTEFITKALPYFQENLSFLNVTETDFHEFNDVKMLGLRKHERTISFYCRIAKKKMGFIGAGPKRIWPKRLL